MWIRPNPQPSMIGKCNIICCVTHHVLVLVVLLVCHTVGVPAEAIPALGVQGAAVLTPPHLPLANPSLLAVLHPGVGLLKAGAVTVAAARSLLAAAAPELLLPGGGAPPLLAATRPPVVRPLLLAATPSPALAAILLLDRPPGLAVGAATLQLLSPLG
jgi:hypothetical protein